MNGTEQLGASFLSARCHSPECTLRVQVQSTNSECKSKGAVKSQSKMRALPSDLSLVSRRRGFLRQPQPSHPTKENHVSKTWEHYHHAARDHEKAAYHFNEAAKYNQAEEREKAAHHAYLAHGHSQQAVHHAAEAAKLHAEQHNNRPALVAADDTKKKSAASLRDETTAKTAGRS